MSDQKTYIIGDIHGHLDKFESILDAIPIVEGDRIVILGDMIDRGPKPKKVIERIMHLRTEGWDIIALKGNHEQMFIDVLRGNRGLDLFVYNGGRTTLRDYKRRGELWAPRAHAKFFASLPLYYEGQDFICVHAGLRPGVPLAEQTEEDLLWIREEFLDSDYDLGKVVIHGHTPSGPPIIRKNRIGIDTGSAFGGPLTCLCLPDREFYLAQGEGQRVKRHSVAEIAKLEINQVGQNLDGDRRP